MKKGLILISSIAVFALLLAACGQQSEENLNNSLKLGMLPIEDNFPFFVAEAEEMFAESGLDVELIPFNSARDRDTALEAGEVDGEAADLVAAALLKKGGTDVKVVSLTMGATPQEGRFALLAAPDSGITTPEELKDVPVAVSENTIIEYVNYRMLRGAGLASDHIVVESVPAIPQRLELLLNGSVKAAVLPDPIATLAEETGAEVIIDDTKLEENLSQVVLLFREEVLETKGEAVIELLKVYKEAAAKVSNDTTKYQELFVEKARVPNRLEDSYLAPHYSSPAVPGKSEVKAVMDWMQYKGLLSAAYEFEELVDSSFLEGVD